jgi:hypothetical protein
MDRSHLKNPFAMPFLAGRTIPNDSCRTPAQSHAATVPPSSGATGRSSAPQKSPNRSPCLIQHHLWREDLYQMMLHRPIETTPFIRNGQTFCTGSHAPSDPAKYRTQSSALSPCSVCIAGRIHTIKRYVPTMDKTMRMHSITSTIENGFVHLPDKAAWLGEYLHELTTFPKAKNDDQADSTSQALDWFKSSVRGGYGLLDYARQESDRRKAAQQASTVPESKLCSRCNSVMSQPIPGGLRCAQCGAQWSPPTSKPRVLTRKDVLNRASLFRF